MDINRNNYMLYFLDYYEGMLSDDQHAELMRFLDDHADLKVAFYDFELVELPKDHRLRFPGKEALKKPAGLEANVKAGYEQPFKLRKEKPIAGVLVTPENYEELFAAYMEGDLDAEAAAAVEAFAQKDGFYRRELEMMEAAVLVPDDHIRYLAKSKLKRHFIGILTERLRPYTSAAAAVLLLAALLYSIYPVFDTAPVAEDIPVAGDGELPEAVAEAPAPQQDADRMLAELEGIGTSAVEDASQTIREMPVSDERRALASLLPAPQPTISDARSHISSTISLDLTAFRRQPDSPPALRNMRLEPKAADRLIASADIKPTTIETREELTWIAYLDPSERPWATDRDAHDTGRREVSAGELAANRLSGAIGIDLEKLADGDRHTLIDMANSSIARLMQPSGSVLGIETTRDNKGRLKTINLGQNLSISRR